MAEKNDEKKLEDVMEKYKTIREALSGLYEIVNINLTDSNFYHVAAMDNLKALNENIIEILKSSTYPREIRMKLRDLEFDEMEAEKNFPL